MVVSTSLADFYVLSGITNDLNINYVLHINIGDSIFSIPPTFWKEISPAITY